jgi:rRNA-processing protein FCF1
MVEDSLYSNIEYLTCEDLRKKLKPTGIKVAYLRKNELIEKMYDYITSTDNIKDIWNNLNKYEREIIEIYIRMKGDIDSDDLDKIMKKHGKETSYRLFSSWNTLDSIFDNSKAKLLFFGNKMPDYVFNQLKKYVKDIEITFNKADFNEIDLDLLEKVCIEESFEKDFIYTLKLINKSKLKITKKNNYLTKSSFIKINEVLENKELLLDDIEIRDFRNFKYTTRLFGIYQLILEAKLIKIFGDEIKIGPKLDEFLTLGIVEKCKLLLESYKKSQSIDEIERITENKFKYPKSRLNLKNVREVILKYLIKCPIDEWVDINEFSTKLKINSKDFIKSNIGWIELYDDYDRYYYNPRNTWSILEKRFIEISLLEYLSTIGIVDVMVDTNYDDYDDTMYITTNYFRLTKFGAHILGINKNYKPDQIENSKENKFIIQPNFEIIISESEFKHKHCMFFDRFAEKIVDDKITIYKLNFKSMLAAMEVGFDIEEIIQYLEKNTKNQIPENVSMELENWKFESKRINIRTITIVETDDEYLLEELKSYKGIKKNIKSNLENVFEISEKNIKKIKREIEKKNHFCNLK